MAPILYYALFSPPVRGVLLTAKQIGLELDLKPINLFKREHFSEEYLSINPQHTIPTLVDDDFVLWDSHAIITYLVQKYADDDSLYPTDIQKRAKIDQRLHFDSSILFPITFGIVRGVIFSGSTEISTESKERAMYAYDLLEKFLKDDQYLCGNSLTVADLSLTPMISMLNELIPIDEEKFPKLNDYLNRMASELPDYEEINVKGNEMFMEFIKGRMEENRLKQEKI